MEIFTLDRSFKKEFIIDVFNSAIWTERYYGDSDVELVVPLTMDMIDKLSVGTFLGLTGSGEVMILETMSIEKNSIKVTGISVLSWLNNRIIRTSPKHEDRYWYVSGWPAGRVLWEIIHNMCCWSSNYVTGYYNWGIPHGHQLGIDGLTLGRYDTSGPNISVGIPFGPVYDAMRDIATTYEIGMRIVLTYVTDQPYATHNPAVQGGQDPYVFSPYYLEFTSYRGNDRSSSQTDFPVVRFSPQTDSLNNIKEIQSATDFKTVIYSFAPENPGGLATSIGCGRATLISQYEIANLQDWIWSFDVRALMTFEDDITTDMVGTSSSNLLAVLNSRANDALTSHPFAIAVDGEISPKNQYQYGTDYGLGDIIEVQGNSGATQRARVTEFIRAQDQAGERSYPTVTMFSN
jgi:Siphovirus ReqiPepy6 Gp37-like protein